jgi:hypothetical protein
MTFAYILANLFCRPNTLLTLAARVRQGSEAQRPLSTLNSLDNPVLQEVVDCRYHHEHL